MHHPRTRAKCNYAKAQKKDKRRVEKCTERNRFEASIKNSGGTVGKPCKRGAHYCVPALDVTRRSEAMIEINALSAHFRNLLGQSPTAYLPPPSFQGVFRKGAEALAYQFTESQLLPSVELTYVETSPSRYSEIACTWAGEVSYWERDFDLLFNLEKSETVYAQLQCKGFGAWFRPLYRSLASTDYARRTSAPFLGFYRLFRRMAGFAIRHFVNELQWDYQSVGSDLPLLYASYESLEAWLGDGYRLDSADDLLALYSDETIAFRNRFERLFRAVFPLEWQILTETLARARYKCSALREYGFSLTARDVAVVFAVTLQEVKAARHYDNNREECRARFEELVAEVNALTGSARMTREQALYHLLPRPPRKM